MSYCCGRIGRVVLHKKAKYTDKFAYMQKNLYLCSDFGNLCTKINE